MKPYHLLLLLFILSCTTTKKSIAPRPTPPKEPLTFLQFSQLTNAADLALLDSNLAFAVQLYSQAFAKMEVDYAAPYYNAYLAAKEIGDCEMSFFAAKHLLEFGAWIKQFQKNPCLVDNDYLWTEIEDKYMTSQNNEKYFNSLQKIDYQMVMLHNTRLQAIKHLLNNTKFKNKDSLPEIDFKHLPRVKMTNDEKLHQLDSLTNEWLMLVNKYGFPSERKIGAEWSLAGITFHNYRHYAPMYQRNKQVKNIFDQALIDGLIAPGQYAELDSAQRYFINPIFDKGEPAEQYVFVFTEKELKRINQARSKIGLPPLETQLKTRKIIKKWLDDDYYFAWLGNLRQQLLKPPKHPFRRLE